MMVGRSIVAITIKWLLSRELKVGMYIPHIYIIITTTGANAYITAISGGHMHSSTHSTNLIHMIQFTVSPAENAKDGCCCKEQVTGVVHRLTLTRQAPMSNNISNLTFDGFTRCTGYAPGVEIWGPSAK
jgi:hypothetical protein